ncbi:MAG TPA: hypothetical protein VMA74_14945 [Dyella sp.]|nr:hypothetical protein [Dyella sp.]HUB91018.1 hypothetical protein [Dyella sp.]
MGSGDGQVLVAKGPDGYRDGARQKDEKILLDDVPLNLFHCRIAALAAQ